MNAVILGDTIAPLEGQFHIFQNEIQIIASKLFWRLSWMMNSQNFQSFFFILCADFCVGHRQV